ncbi:MAG: pantoate--beta-alanine ligase [Granulosicoccaceae bacterium]
MIRVDSIEDLREVRHLWRLEDKKVGFVPTMGNLHNGHLSLLDKAREHADKIICSIYVNPLQFDRPGDLANYPRTLENDMAKLREIGADLVFCPTDKHIYPRGMEHATTVDVPGITDVLDGAHRPGHFIGVATVVCKLFNMVQPELAVFGEKDFQQLLVVRRMTADLNLPVEIIGAPTAREDHGLAMSSRNNYLTPKEREQGGWLYKLLCQGAESLLAGKSDHRSLEADMENQLRQLNFDPDYYSIRRTLDLEPAREGDAVEDLIILVAAQCGKARLIDNLALASYIESR